MPDNRIHQSIAERFDIDFHRDTDPVRRRRRVVTWLAGIIPAMLLGATWFGNNQVIFQASPLSNSHGTLQHDCQACHTQAFQTLKLMIRDNEFMRSVEHQSCRRCHVEQAVDHHSNMIVSRDTNCFACHREHRGMVDLKRVNDRYCTSCHRELRVVDEAGQHTLSDTFANEVTSLSNHPEFAIWRAPAEVPNSAHGIHSVAKTGMDAKGNEVWLDRGTVRFPHDKHLNPDGVLVPELASPSSQTVAADASPNRRVLNCDTCHQLDENGQYMLPVNYESHCSECHPLTFSSKLGALPLPHEQTDIVEGAMIERFFSQFDQENQQPVTPDLPTDDRSNGRSRLPNKSTEPALSVEQMESLLRKFVPADDLTLTGAIRRGCQYCHETTESAKRILDFAVVDPAIPNRWLTHSRFLHDRHSTMDCGDCHAATTSSQSDDILMPDIDNCSQCHVPRTWLGNHGASSDCVECHTYHHVSATERVRFQAAKKARDSRIENWSIDPRNSNTTN